MLSQGVPLGSEAAPNTDAIGNQICFSVLKGASIPNHEEICPELCLRILVTCLRKGKSLYLLQRLLVSEAVSQLFSEENSLPVPVGCHHNCRKMRSWRTGKGTRELWHSSPSGACEHDAPRHNVHVTCLIIQVSVPQCRANPVYLVIAPEQWNLSEAEETNETSGTNGNGVHHYLRGPRDVVTLEHKHPWWTSLYYIRDIRHLKQVVNQIEHRVRCLLFDRSWGPSTSQGTYGGYPIL